jgi:hypothetical protein
MLTTTQSSQKQFYKSCVRVSLELKPAMLPFFTASEVNKEKHTLKPYMAPVNHNHINEITWLKIVHTLMGNFCQDSDDKNNTMPMEDMGRDACVMIGCHKLGSDKRVSHLMTIYKFFWNGKHV